MSYSGRPIGPVFGCLVILAFVSCAPPVVEELPKKAVRPVTIQVDNTLEHQTMEGFGATTLASVIFTGSGVKDMLAPELRQQAIEAVYGDVGLTMGNLALWLEPANDDEDPFNYNWNGFRWDSFNAMHELLVQPASTFGFNNYALGLKINTRWALKWMVDLRETDYERYLHEVAEYVSAGTVYWRKTFGLNPGYIFLFNEPLSGNRELKGGTVEEVVDIIKYTGDRLRAEGFDNVKFIVPGEETVEQSIETARMILSDKEVRKYVGAIAYHAYPYGSPYSSIRRILETSGAGRPYREEIRMRKGLQQLGKQYGLPVWMTEITEGPGNADFEFGAPENMRARAIHIHDELVYANASAYFGMNNMWDRYSHEAHFRNRNIGFLTQTSNIALIDQESSKVYITGMGYAIGHYTRWIEQGAIRIEATSGDPLIQVSAFRDDSTERLTIVIINNNNEQRNVTVELKNFQIDGPVVGERSDETVRWERIDSFEPVKDGRFQLVMDDRTVLTVSAPIK